MQKIIMTTQDQLVDHQIEKTLGLVRGNTVRSRNVVSNFIAALRTIIGGEISELTQAVNESRDEALKRLEEHAIELGADAVVGVRFVSSELGQSCSEIMAFGTAVKLR
jgi:uncharacterized protein YbjQ (UPF0145 family)